ncbi:MAG: lipid-binding SYLF domain-containing protein [Candidatus Eisenbacteria bacterium]
MKRIARNLSLVATVGLCSTAVVAHAGDGKANAAHHEIHANNDSNEYQRAVMAGDVINEMMTGEDQEIPEALLEKANGIAVIPHVVKGAFVVGGQFGKGIVTQRLADGTWSRPVFVDLGSVSYGFQAGVEATDVVLVFLERDGLNSLLDDALKLGANASVAAGPVGRSAEAGTNLTLDSAIYAYSRSKGVFAGIAVDGAVLSMDDSANQRCTARR